MVLITGDYLIKTTLLLSNFDHLDNLFIRMDQII
jgi:hypothetical protein